jgi:threonine/homoserine/homoserine lactone efflux protein
LDRRAATATFILARTMISIPLLMLFLLAAGALILIPGPAVLFIVARSIHQGSRAGVVSALGVACGGLVHIAGAVLGFSALLASSVLAFTAVRWIGAAYLIYLGIKTWLSRDDEPAEVPPPVPPRRLFAQGFVVNLTNPKTALFFFAFLPQFVDPSLGNAPLQMLILGAIFTAMSVTSDSTYAVLASALKGRFARNATARRNVRWVSGGVYVALGLGTALAGSRTSKT